MYRQPDYGYAQPSGGPSSSAEPCVCIDVPPDANPHLDRWAAVALKSRPQWLCRSAPRHAAESCLGLRHGLERVLTRARALCCPWQVFSAARLGGWYAGQQSAHHRQGDVDAPGGRRRHGARGAAEGQGLAHLHHLRLRREHGGSESTLPQGWHVDVASAWSNAPPPPPCSARARRLRILRAPFGCRLGTPLGENRPRGAQPPPRVLEPAASTASTVASIAASIASTASGPAGAKHLRYPCIIPLAVQVRSRARAQQDDGVGVSGGVPRDHAVTLPQTPTPNSNPNPNPNPNPNQVRHATHSVSESLPELNVLSGALTPDSQP